MQLRQRSLVSNFLLHFFPSGTLLHLRLCGLRELVKLCHAGAVAAGAAAMGGFVRVISADC